MNIEFQVTGVKWHWDAFNRAQVKRGDFLTLRAEPENKHDPNAVAVYKGEHHIGYVPRNSNQEVGKALREDQIVEVRVSVDWPAGCEARVKLKEPPYSETAIHASIMNMVKDGDGTELPGPVAATHFVPRARAEELRNFVDPLHGHDTDPLRNYIRMTGGHCSGGGGPC